MVDIVEEGEYPLVDLSPLGSGVLATCSVDG